MATIQMLSAALLMLLLVMGHTHIGLLDSDTDSASAAQLTGEGAHHPQGRSAAEERYKWHQCLEKQCKEDLTCSECGPDDEGCAAMCRMNCWCGCGGHPRGGMDHDVWKACIQARNCRGDFEVKVCTDSCRENEDCMVRCELDHPNLCHCGCMLTATQRKHNWDTCIVQSQCHNKTCSECSGSDVLCAKRCARRCQCQCADYPLRDLSGEWEECFVGTQTCEEAHSACVKVCCDRDECRHGCDLALIECRCVCRSATEEEWLLWIKCKEEDEECGDNTCSECGEGDTDCAARCRHNCECRRCLGIPADSLDDLSVHECKKSGCLSEHKKCKEKCKAPQDKECEHSCQLAKEKCHCKCAQTSSETESRESEREEIIQHCNFIC